MQQHVHRELIDVRDLRYGVDGATSQPTHAMRLRKNTRRVSGQACMTSSTESSVVMRVTSILVAYSL